MMLAQILEQPARPSDYFMLVLLVLFFVVGVVAGYAIRKRLDKF